jgi:lipoprotein-releasing system ATP-binding protein
MNQANNEIVIELSNVVKSYNIESQVVPALRGVDLKIKRGERVSVTGTSGSGKSTILHMIGTLDKPTKGKVLLNGSDITNMNDQLVSSFRNSTIGFVFQMNNLLPEFSAIENVMMPGLISGVSKTAVKEKASLLLKAVGLSHRENHRPGELSGGEQQRVAIARALLMDPPILLADEPTGNLDKKTSSAIEDLLLQLCEDNSITMLLVTHDLELAKKFDKRIVMEDGQIIEKIGLLND